ncbi:MAG: cache domain-containing protein, partial [Omnitrophica WOR_2 bacterium]
MSNFFSSLRSRLLLLVLISALPALALMLYSGVEQRRLATSVVQEDNLRIARLAASNNEALIEGARQLLISLASNPQITQKNQADCGAFLAALWQKFPFYTTFSVADVQGNIYCSSVTNNSPVNVSDRPYFQQVLKTGDFTIGEYSVGRITGKSILPFAYPIKNVAGNVQGVVIAPLDLSWMNKLAASIKLPPEAAMLIIGSDGTVLTRYPNPELWTGKQPDDSRIIQTILAKQGEGTAEVTGVDGIMRLYAFTPLQGGAAKAGYVAIGIPTANAYAGPNRILARNLIGLGLVTILGLGVAWIVGDIFFLQLLGVLLNTTRRLASGDLSARARMPVGRNELVQLGVAFDQMADRLEQRDYQLRQAEARYRSLVEQIPAITYTANPGENYQSIYISPQVKTILGYSAEEWLSIPDVLTSHLHPEDCERVKAEIAGSRTRREPLRTEYRFISKTGRLVWIRDECILVNDPQGKDLLWQGIMLDITEQKRAEIALRNYSVELEHKNQDLQDFAYIASHDLQEPLRKIQAFGERLKTKYSEILTAEGQDYLQRMQSAAARMQTMINDLLAYSRVTTRAQAFKQVDLNRITTEVLADLETRITETSGRVEVEPLPEIQAEPT